MHDQSIQPIIQPTELGETLDKLNDDKIGSYGQSGIDMRTRLGYSEISGILAVDFLVQNNVLPVKIGTLTQQKKRLAISLRGKGRDEIVQIVGGKREGDVNSGKSLFSKWFGKKDE